MDDVRIFDSRRLFGPNLFSARPGAVLDVECVGACAISAVEAWPTKALSLAGSIGWADVECATRRSSSLASLFLSAPIDGLLTATEVAEEAWLLAERGVDCPTDPDASVVSRLRAKYAGERATMTGYVQLARSARQRGRNVTLSDDGLLLGGGAGSTFYPKDGASTYLHGASRFTQDGSSEVDLPPLRDADAGSDCPIVLVTGSNGKTTTTRLLAAMFRASGRVTGWSCSDGVWVDDDQLEDGDYSGPAGACRVLDDTRVETAVLESARGGMLRRGLAVTAADIAVITNVSADHLGEFGVESIADLTQVKAIVVRALRPGATLVLNADDPALVELSQGLSVPVAWFSSRDLPTEHEPLHEGDGLLERSVGDALGATVRDGRLILRIESGDERGSRWHDVIAVADMPLSFHGAAAHNVQNALAAALLVLKMGIDVAVISHVLGTFGNSDADNPGRMVVRQARGVTIVMDYAHNPDGIAALCGMSGGFGGKRRLLLLGQAGDRDDAQITALAHTAWRTVEFDRIIVKELPAMLRGRKPGETSALIRRALLDAGAPEDRLSLAGSEIEGVQQALVWAEPGDLLMLGVHTDRDAVYELVDRFATSGLSDREPRSID